MTALARVTRKEGQWKGGEHTGERRNHVAVTLLSAPCSREVLVTSGSSKHLLGCLLKRQAELQGLKKSAVDRCQDALDPSPLILRSAISYSGRSSPVCASDKSCKAQTLCR